MIIQHTIDGSQVLFVPEDLKERKALDSFPGLLRHGLQFHCPNKANVVYNLYQRLKRRFKNIKYTKAIQEIIEGEIEIKQLPDWFRFHTAPLKHQLIALRFAYTFGSFLNLSEPGLGKTKVTLDYIWLVQAKKSLIVCPKALRFVWEEERVKHRPELSVYVIESTDWAKEEKYILAADVVVVNYDKAVTLEEPLKALKFDFIAVDEGLIKDPRTERTKALTRLREGIPNRCVMSGTLVNNSPLDVFAPLRFVEPALVGESYPKFRDAHAVLKRLKGGTGAAIVIGYRNVSEVKEMLGCCGIIMTKAEWLKSLPPKKFIHKYVQMGDKQRDYYQKLASNYLLVIPELDAEIEVDNPLSVLIKLNQISNGFIYYKEDTEETIDDLYGTETKKRSKADRKTLIFEEQPKAKALLQLIQSEEFNSPEGETNPIDGKPYSGPPEVGPGVASGAGEINGSGTEELRGDVYKCGNDISDEPNVEYGRERLHRLLPGTSSQCSGSCGGSGLGETSDGRRSPCPNGYSTTVCQCDTGRGLLDNVQVPDDISKTDTRSASESSSDKLGQRHAGGITEPTKGSNKRSGRRAIIWYNLDAERAIIEKSLGEAGVPFLTIAGGTKNIGGLVRRFNTDASVRFLLCQAKTINYGVTIMGTKESDADEILPQFDPQVSDEIFYSLNFSLEVFLQQQDRIHRIGQTRTCRYWLLLTNSKIERSIADRLEEKLLCNKEILVDIMSSLDKSLLIA